PMMPIFSLSIICLLSTAVLFSHRVRSQLLSQGCAGVCVEEVDFVQVEPRPGGRFDLGAKVSRGAGDQLLVAKAQEAERFVAHQLGNVDYCGQPAVVGRSAHANSFGADAERRALAPAQSFKQALVERHDNAAPTERAS